MFDGKARQRTVSAAGLGRKNTSNNKEIIENARKQRQQRQDDKAKQNASIKIQSFLRGTLARSHVRNVFRGEFDSKLAGVQKIKALFQQTQKKNFLVPNETLLTLLRLYRASYFPPTDTMTKSRYIFILGLLNESLDTLSPDSNILYLLSNPNQNASVPMVAVDQQVTSFLEIGLNCLDISSTNEEWSSLARVLQKMDSGINGVSLQVSHRLRRSLLRAALLPLTSTEQSTNTPTAFGLACWVVQWITGDLIRSLKRRELWNSLEEEKKRERAVGDMNLNSELVRYMWIYLFIYLFIELMFISLCTISLFNILLLLLTKGGMEGCG